MGDGVRTEHLEIWGGLSGALFEAAADSGRVGWLFVVPEHPQDQPPQVCPPASERFAATCDYWSWDGPEPWPAAFTLRAHSGTVPTCRSWRETSHVHFELGTWAPFGDPQVAGNDRFYRVRHHTTQTVTEVGYAWWMHAVHKLVWFATMPEGTVVCLLAGPGDTLRFEDVAGVDMPPPTACYRPTIEP